jgi:hypothetical protein
MSRLILLGTLLALLGSVNVEGRPDDKKAGDKKDVAKKPEAKKDDEPRYLKHLKTYQYPKAKRYGEHDALKGWENHFASGSAKYQSTDSFEEVVKWYIEKHSLGRGDGIQESGGGKNKRATVTHDSRLSEGYKDRPLALWVVTVKHTKPGLEGHVVNIVVSQVKGEKTTDILISVITNKTEED